MFDKLDATIYRNSVVFYEESFEDLLSKITLCYRLMKSDNIIVVNDENKIRDVMFLQYLNNNKLKEQLQLSHWYFIREALEDSTVGRTDIKVISHNTFENTEAYYIIECKRLDIKATKGTSGLNAKYIEHGMSRFTTNYYASHYRVNGMIGFIVEKMDIHSNTKKINKLLKDFGTPVTTKYLTKDSFIPNFDYQYHSTHLDNNGDELKIYHLMFDFIENIGTP